MSIVKKITNIGTRKDLSICENKYIRLTNAVNLGLIFFISLPAVLANVLVLNNETEFHSRYLSLIVFSLLNMYLNSKHKYLFSKLNTLLSPFILIFILPAFTHSLQESMFISFPFGIMVIGGLAFMLFSYGAERVYLHGSVLFFALSSLFYDSFLKLFINQDLNVSFLFDHSETFVHFQVTKTIILIFLYVYLYKLKVDYHNSQVSISEMNKTLALVNKDLKDLNVNLEELVYDRTLKLEAQNQRIKELAYTNSHIIRAYVARITGLINMAELRDVSDEEKQFCYSQIKENSLGLDNITKNLSESLVVEECSNSPEPNSCPINRRNN